MKMKWKDIKVPNWCQEFKPAQPMGCWSLIGACLPESIEQKGEHMCSGCPSANEKHRDWGNKAHILEIIKNQKKLKKHIAKLPSKTFTSELSKAIKEDKKETTNAD